MLLKDFLRSYLDYEKTFITVYVDEVIVFDKMKKSEIVKLYDSISCATIKYFYVLKNELILSVVNN